MEIRWGEVDGVRALTTVEGAVQGPLHACLMFGVGRSDETMTVSGVNHVVEHLALQPVGTKPYEWNGDVRPVSTRFLASGYPEQIVEFLDLLTKNLRELPMERLGDEARVLQIEGERHGHSQVGFDLSVRFGPRGVGLLGWPEHGLRRLEAPDVLEWARTWFTAQNAVLWMSGPIPAGLSLRHLPQGDAPARRPPPPSIPPTRSWVGAKTKTVSLSLVSEQQWGILPAMALARQRAFERLRRRDALSYAVEFLHIRVGGGRSLEYLGADGGDGSHRQILDGLTNVVEELAQSGPTGEEMEMFHQLRLQQQQHPQFVLGYLDSYAERRLLGLPVFTPDEDEAVMAALTVETLRRDLASVLPTILAIGPKELQDDLPGWSLYLNWSSVPPSSDGSSSESDDRTFHAIEGREKGTLVIGSDGLSWILDEDRCRSVRWDEAVACFTWDNGMREVLGPSGSSVLVAPWNWQAAEGLTVLVDDRVRPECRIRVGEGQSQYRRDPNDAGSVADVHWLGTLIGAMSGQQRVDLVIDTDGCFVLYGRHARGTVPDRLQELRSMDRTALLAKDPRNRWIPESEIEEVKLVKRPLSRINSLKGTLTIRQRDQKRLKIHLVNSRQMEIAQNELQKLLGGRFVR